MLLTKESAVYKIFHWPFRFRIPYHNLIDYETAEKWGVRGAPEAAREQALALVDVHLTINQLLDYYREGATVQLVHLTDAAVIHQILVEHFTLWIEAFAESQWSYQPPLADLKLMCALGEELLSLQQNHCPKPNVWGQMLLIQEKETQPVSGESCLFELLTIIEKNQRVRLDEY